MSDVRVTLNPETPPLPEPQAQRSAPSPVWNALDPAKNGWEIVTDQSGRQLAVKELSALDQLDLTEACDVKADTNRYYFMAVLAATVRAINGDALAFPRTNQQLRSHIAQVGNEGINAVGDWLAQRRELTAKNSEKDIATAGK